jgi:thioredoxin-related protein
MKSMALRCLGMAALLLCSSSSRAAIWLTDYDAALVQAKNERKLVLMNFTGSDWCGWCMKLKAEVFDTPAFATFADANLILLEVDFPRRRPMTSQQRQANQALAEKFGVSGYPTIVIADGLGRLAGELGYMPGGPRPFIEKIKSIRGFEWKDVAAEQTPGETKPEVPAKDEPLWGGLVTPPKQYNDLKLTGISGSASRRFAIINNQTFAPGETAKVKLKDTQVKVLCKEIRPNSVLIQIDGSNETKELILGK